MDKSTPWREELTTYRPRGRDAVKAWAKRLGVNALDLIVLSESHDPFYAGGEADEAKARWFKAIWVRFGFQEGFHNRRGHYRIVVDNEPTQTHEGKPYVNILKHWKDFLTASKKARELTQVDASLFVDRRNDEPYLFAPDPRETPVPFASVTEPAFIMPGIEVTWESDVDPSEIEVSGYDYDPYDQPYHLEIPIEKTTQNDIVVPWCRRNHVNLVTSSGTQSISGSYQLLERAAHRYRKPTRVGYIADRDLKGEDMPVSFSRHIEFYAHMRRLAGDLKLRLLALTDAQIEEYNLPRAPSEGKQGEDRFEEEHGGTVELDALEALHPGELERILDDWIAPYVDDTLEDRLAEAEEEAAQTAIEAWDQEIADELQELETVRQGVDSVMETYRAEIEDLQHRLEEDLRPYREQVDDITSRISAKADTFDPWLPKRPVAEVGGDLNDDEWLFDLSRDYLDQINAYRRYENKPRLTQRREPRPPTSPTPTVSDHVSTDHQPRRRLVRIGARRHNIER